MFKDIVMHVELFLLEIYINDKNRNMFLSEKVPTLETLDFAFRGFSAVYQPFIFRFVSLHCLRSTLRLFH